jgi:CheY-like chemotaxis protein
MKKLLIVDDEVNMQKVLSILFRRERYEVMTVSNGKEALDKLESGVSFDLILSDMKMPRMDGIELLKYLKKSQINIPLILITAYGSHQVTYQFF